MTLAHCPAPTTAERIRSTCVRAGGALLAVDSAEPLTTPLHHLLADGSFAVGVPIGGPVAEQVVDCGAAGAPAVLELADYAPLPLREPVRSLVWIRGRLHQVSPSAVSGLLDLIAAEHPHPALLQVQTPGSGPASDGDTQYLLARLEIESVVVTDATGAEAVDAAALLAARADPFSALESSWIKHLDTAHRDVVARLAARLPARLRRGDVRPLGIDRYGMRLRVESAEGDSDVRLPFRKPVDDLVGLGQAIRVLMGCPFVNGLRAGPGGAASQGGCRCGVISPRSDADGQPVERRPLRVELAIVLSVTFGLSAVTAILQLADGVLRGLSGQRIPLNPKRSYFDLIDLGLNATVVVQLVAWGALGLYLLWRTGLRPADVGLAHFRWRPDLLGGVGLAALIGLPGLALYLAARALHINASVIPSGLGDTWWRVPMLVLTAFADGWAEEIIVVGYLLTRLGQLGVGPRAALVWSSVLRGAYHLYQGFGAGLGNIAMGLVFGYAWQRTGRLWPLVIAHGLIDTVAFVGYALLAGHLGWLH